MTDIEPVVPPQEQTPDFENMTFLQLFSYFCDHHQPPQHEENSNRQSYTIYEDLKIILALIEHPEINNKVFKKIEESKQIFRSYQSIKDRYTEFLKNLNQEELQIIAAHLKLHQCKGYLQFNNEEPRKLMQITLIDPKIIQAQHFKRKLDPLENQKSAKKKKIESEIEKIHPRSKFDVFTVEDLDEVMQVISNWKRVPKSVLVDRLNQLSGYFVDLDEYLLTLDDSKCWLAEEDEVLKKAPSKEDLGIKYLLKRKGYDRVKRRVKYLNIDLPFEV